jgi:hypothetical protein
MKIQETPLLPADTPQALKVALSKWMRESATEINHQPIAIVIAVGDETTAITTGTAKVTFRMPYAIDLNEIRGSLSTAQTSGSIFTVDVNNAGTSLLSTKLTIDNTEKTSTTAATPAVLTYATTQILADAEVTIDVDQIGDGTAKGLKVTLIGRMV